MLLRGVSPRSHGCGPRAILHLEKENFVVHLVVLDPRKTALLESPTTQSKSFAIYLEVARAPGRDRV
eukprot:2531307-Pyramimonas_sp.AAC.1